jgi:hypothetical protein
MNVEEIEKQIVEHRLLARFELGLNFFSFNSGFRPCEKNRAKFRGRALRHLLDIEVGNSTA